MWYVDDELIAGGRMIPADSKVDESNAPAEVIVDLRAVMNSGGPVRFEAEPDLITKPDSTAPIRRASKPGTSSIKPSVAGGPGERAKT
jgi:hypothetical protein